MSAEEQPVEETTELEVPEVKLERQESVLEVPIETIAPKPKPKARGKRGPDKQPRVKPKPKARAAVVPSAEHGRKRASAEESESEESADEATLQELHSLNLLRSIRQHESQRHSRKQQLYASWFAR